MAKIKTKLKAKTKAEPKTKPKAKTKAKAFDAADYLDSPEGIAAYLSEAFETGDDDLITQALGAVARVKGMKSVAKEAGVNRENLYRSLTSGGRPELATVMKILDALDVQLVAKPKDQDAKAA